MLWDKSVIRFQNIELTNKNEYLSYMVTKGPMNFSRDFVEKRVSFKDPTSAEEISVYWQTEDERFPKESSLTRAYTKIGGTFIKKNNDNCIEVWTISQVDTDIKSFLPLIRRMLPANVEKWVNSLRDFLKTNN